MNSFFIKIREFFNFIKGWIEISSKNTPEYQYFMTEINIVSNTSNDHYFTEIIYKVVGSRVVFKEKTVELNNSGAFGFFRKDQAQIIVSLATLESAIKLNKEELMKKYLTYAKLCSQKINEKENYLD